MEVYGQTQEVYGQYLCFAFGFCDPVENPGEGAWEALQEDHKGHREEWGATPESLNQV